MPDIESVRSRLRPGAAQEDTRSGVARASVYGDQYQYQGYRHALADEGSYYTVTNPTMDTTVAYGVIATFVSTTPAFLISNTAP